MRILETLTYINERGNSVEFSLRSKYHTNIEKDVTGLDDIRNHVFSINSMGQDGDSYLGNRIIARDIEIVGHIKERNKERAKLLRRKMRNVLNPQLGAMLIYRFGDFVRVINCDVVNASDLKKQPIFREFTIQLVCLFPYWRMENDLRLDIATWVGGMEFKVREPDDQPDGLEICADEGWEIGWREPALIVNAINAGDVRAGMRVDFRALGSLLNPLLLNVVTGQFIKINMPMLPGDAITVNTYFGEKGVTLRRQGETTDIFRYLDPDSTYIQLEAGDNVFRYDADENMELLDITIHHNNFFFGV